jgi:hypothetical protein
MEVKRDQNVNDSYSFSSLGKGFQYLVQAPLFVLVGVFVAVWEMINNLFQTVYQQGAQYTAHVSGNGKQEATPNGLKVPMLPIDNYSQLSVREITGQLDGLSPEDLQVVKQYERSHKKRASILETIDRRLANAR